MRLVGLGSRDADMVGGFGGLSSRDADMVGGFGGLSSRDADMVGEPYPAGLGDDERDALESFDGFWSSVTRRFRRVARVVRRAGRIAIELHTKGITMLAPGVAKIGLFVVKTPTLRRMLEAASVPMTGPLGPALFEVGASMAEQSAKHGLLKGALRAGSEQGAKSLLSGTAGLGFADDGDDVAGFFSPNAWPGASDNGGGPRLVTKPTGGGWFRFTPGIVRALRKQMPKKSPQGGGWFSGIRGAVAFSPLAPKRYTLAETTRILRRVHSLGLVRAEVVRRLVRTGIPAGVAVEVVDPKGKLPKGGLCPTRAELRETARRGGRVLAGLESAFGEGADESPFATAS